MCRTSNLAPDWITKGCHIVVLGVELTLCPDHLGGVLFHPFFSNTQKERADASVKAATEECLPDANVRRQWIRSIRNAMALMAGQEGELRELAIGRMAEFKFLIIALERYEE